MGLETDDRSNRIFLSIMKGRITLKVDANTEGAKQRTNKLGTVVWEKHYTSLTGIIIYIRTRDHAEYGKFWDIGVQDGADVFSLQFPYNSGYAMGFLKRIESVNLAIPVKFNPYYIPEEGTDKFRSFLILYQNDKKIPSLYTRENPNGLPELKEITVDNKKTWDSTDQMKFFEDILDNEVRPNLTKPGEALQQESEASPPDDVKDQPAENEDDDLPF